MVVRSENLRYNFAVAKAGTEGGAKGQESGA